MKSSKRETLLCGGFSNSPNQLQAVADEVINLGLADSVNLRTFPEAFTSSEAPYVSSLLTFSGGIMGFREGSCKDIVAFAPVLPKSSIRYVGATAVKTYRNFTWGRERRLTREVNQFNLRALATLFSGGSMGHWRPYLDGSISRFDSVAVVTDALEKGRAERAQMVFGEQDAYFMPNDAQAARIESAGIQLMILSGIVHDSLVIDPRGTLEEYIKARDSLQGGC